MEIGPQFRTYLVPLLRHDVEDVRLNTGRSIAAALKLHPQQLSATLETIYAAYMDALTPPPTDFDKFGVAIPVPPEQLDKFGARSGLVWAIQASAESIVATGKRNAESALFLCQARASLFFTHTHMRTYTL